MGSFGGSCLDCFLSLALDYFLEFFFDSLWLICFCNSSFLVNRSYSVSTLFFFFFPVTSSFSSLNFSNFSMISL